jgi:predicted nucleic acid-binding protein
MNCIARPLLGVQEIPVPADAAVRLAQRRARTNLRLPDCCVLLAAQDARATAILTFDARLDHAAADLGSDTPGGRPSERAPRGARFRFLALESP